jgi:hypothetical protein
MTLLIAIIGCVLSVMTFFLGRKDKAVKDTKDEASERKLVEYRLDALAKKVDKILEKLENQEKETRAIAREEIEKHVLKYHQK